MSALHLETLDLTKRFGQFTALDHVSLTVRPGTVHALLGENGAGKSTLVKSIVGYYRPDEGSVMIDGRETDIHSPVVARQLHIGMVYQHFTVVPGMTVAENLLLARGELPAVIHWKRVREELQAFINTTPFKLDLDARPQNMSAGEKQKLEILKQWFLHPRLLILDEPTSVLTPQEADEVLGALRDKAHSGECSIILITHKFREVLAFADDLSVLRKGKLTDSAAVSSRTTDQMAAAMMGEDRVIQAPLSRTPRPASATTMLTIEDLQVSGDRGEPAVRHLHLQVNTHEIVGVAGVSGNGQRELMQSLTGQRPQEGGRVTVKGQTFRATRAQNQQLNVRSLPEEPLQNASVGELSVAHNMALRIFDQSPWSKMQFVKWGALRAQAKRWIAEYGVKTQSERAPIKALSGGNVQRAILARELDGEPELLLVSNPVFGLDFAAVAEIHDRLMQARNRGAAVLLVSEDLDELLKLSDRIVVMSEGHIVYETPAQEANRQTLGMHMAGKNHHATTPSPSHAISAG